MLQEEAQQAGNTSAGFIAESAKRPLGRVGTPEEIAQLVMRTHSSPERRWSWIVEAWQGGFESFDTSNYVEEPEDDQANRLCGTDHHSFAYPSNKTVAFVDIRVTPRTSHRDSILEL